MMLTASELLAAENLAVGRGSVLLRDVRLRLAIGECWFVLGRNGAGKSTLVATLLGLLSPLGGSLAASREVQDRSGIGYVPQEQRFDPPLPLTATEFVELGLRDRLRAAERRERVAHALAAMQVGGLAHAQVRALSLGQRRRVLVARALARRPRLLVLDEPTANLDAHGAGRLCADLERLRAAGELCLLHVAHDLILARKFATHVALVTDGAVHTGEASSLFASGLLEQALGVAAS